MSSDIKKRVTTVADTVIPAIAAMDNLAATGVGVLDPAEVAAVVAVTVAVALNDACEVKARLLVAVAEAIEGPIAFCFRSVLCQLICTNGAQRSTDDTVTPSAAHGTLTVNLTSDPPSQVIAANDVEITAI